MGLHSPSQAISVSKTITFTGSSGAGLKNTAVVVFTATGQVLLHALSTYCTTLLGEAAGTATISLGTTNQVTRFIANTNSVDLNQDEWWVTTTPTTGSIDMPDGLQSVLISENIIINPLTQNTNSGVLVCYAIYEALSSDGKLA